MKKSELKTLIETIVRATINEAPEKYYDTPGQIAGGPKTSLPTVDYNSPKVREELKNLGNQLLKMKNMSNKYGTIKYNTATVSTQTFPNAEKGAVLVLGVDYKVKPGYGNEYAKLLKQFIEQYVKKTSYIKIINLKNDKLRIELNTGYIRKNKLG